MKAESQVRDDFGEIAAKALARVGSHVLPKPPRGAKLKEPVWYAVHTGAGQEILANRKLREAGYWTFYAFDRVRRRRRRPGTQNHIIEWVERPYFSRYIFACLRFANDNVQAIEACDGVSVVVRKPLSGEPLQIPDAQLNRIMEAGMVNFDIEGYCTLMREMVIEPQKKIVMGVNKTGGLSMKYAEFGV